MQPHHRTANTRRPGRGRKSHRTVRPRPERRSARRHPERIGGVVDDYVMALAWAREGALDLHREAGDSTELAALERRAEAAEAEANRRAADFSAARLGYNARRYNHEARYNQTAAWLYEIQVNTSGLTSERHRRRSGLFFHGMLAAQAGVTIATLSLALRQARRPVGTCDRRGPGGRGVRGLCVPVRLNVGHGRRGSLSNTVPFRRPASGSAARVRRPTSGTLSRRCAADRPLAARLRCRCACKLGSSDLVRSRPSSRRHCKGWSNFAANPTPSWARGCVRFWPAPSPTRCATSNETSATCSGNARSKRRSRRRRPGWRRGSSTHVRRLDQQADAQAQAVPANIGRVRAIADRPRRGGRAAPSARLDGRRSGDFTLGRTAVAVAGLIKRFGMKRANALALADALNFRAPYSPLDGVYILGVPATFHSISEPEA